jgi:hypothetical protein
MAEGLSAWVNSAAGWNLRKDFLSDSHKQVAENGSPGRLATSCRQNLHHRIIAGLTTEKLIESQWTN